MRHSASSMTYKPGSPRIYFFFFVFIFSSNRADPVRPSVRHRRIKSVSCKSRPRSPTRRRGRIYPAALARRRERGGSLSATDSGERQGPQARLRHLSRLRLGYRERLSDAPAGCHWTLPPWSLHRDARRSAAAHGCHHVHSAVITPGLTGKWLIMRLCESSCV